MLKKSIISCAMIGVVALAVASSGGGDKKKAASSLRSPDFTPIRTTNGFTLKAGLTYTGSQVYSSVRSNNIVTINSVVTYQKGNQVIILPHRSRVNVSCTESGKRSNLNLLDVKFRFRK